MDVLEAQKTYKKLEGMIRKQQVTDEEIRDSVSTLENYIERYQPLQTLKLLKKLLIPILGTRELQKLQEVCKRFYEEMQTVIIEDIGRGTIFEQLAMINEKMSKRLQLKVDLQEKLMRKTDDIRREAKVD